jgi:hypothetical protein
MQQRRAGQQDDVRGGRQCARDGQGRDGPECDGALRGVDGHQSGAWHAAYQPGEHGRAEGSGQRVRRHG